MGLPGFEIWPHFDAVRYPKELGRKLRANLSTDRRFLQPTGKKVYFGVKVVTEATRMMCVRHQIGSIS